MCCDSKVRHLHIFRISHANHLDINKVEGCPDQSQLSVYVG